MIDKNQDYNKSGIYKLTCNTCKMSYIGQTSRNLNQKYREHIHYIRNNDPQSAYAQHILQNLHEYGCITDTMSLLKPTYKTSMLIPYEQLFIQTFHHSGNLIVGTRHRWTNPLISDGHRHHAYVRNHMKIKADQHATHNTLTSVPSLPR